MHLSGSQPPPLPLLCPNGAPLVQTQSRSRQCMTTLHNVTSADAPTLALQHLATLALPFALKSGGKYTAIYSRFSIETALNLHLSPSPSECHGAPLAHAAWPLLWEGQQLLITSVLTYYRVEGVSHRPIRMIVSWLGNTGLFPIPSLDRYHLCLFWEVAQCKMWMWNQLIIGLPQHHLHASGEWGVQRGSLHGPKLCKSLKEFEQLDAISVWVLSIQLDCNLHDFEIVRFKKHCMIRTPVSFWSSKDALVLISILLLILLIPRYNPTHPHQHISASLSSSISTVLSNKKPSHHAPP